MNRFVDSEKQKFGGFEMRKSGGELGENGEYSKKNIWPYLAHIFSQKRAETGSFVITLSDLGSHFALETGIGEFSMLEIKLTKEESGGIINHTLVLKAGNDKIFTDKGQDPKEEQKQQLLTVLKDRFPDQQQLKNILETGQSEPQRAAAAQSL